ncbi:hypothetical protein [Salinarchaeum chitinilyticum]
MFDWGVVAVALFGLLGCPFVIVAIHQLFATADRSGGRDRGAVDPPSTHETYQSRRIPGSNSAADGDGTERSSR